MTPDPILTSQISDWLNASPKQRSLEDGALLLLRLNANRIMYQQILRNRLAEKLEYELQKHLNIRLHGLTRAEVAKVEKQVMPRFKKELANGEEYRGRRADHDTLPDKVKALYEKNGTRWRQMHRIFETLKTMRDAQPCDRHELVHQLVQLDDAYRTDWEKYDHWTPEDEEPEAEPEPTEAGVREIIAARKAISYGRKKLASETDEAKRAALLIPIKNAVSVLRSANQTFRPDTIDALKELGAWCRQNTDSTRRPAAAWTQPSSFKLFSLLNLYSTFGGAGVGRFPRFCLNRTQRKMEIDLATLESLAEELMPVPDIAIFLGVPEHDLREAIEAPGSPAYVAFNRGRIKVERVLRRRTLMAAADPDAKADTLQAAQELVRRFAES